jgi:hypothetical protein
VAAAARFAQSALSATIDVLRAIVPLAIMQVPFRTPNLFVAGRLTTTGGNEHGAMGNRPVRARMAFGTSRASYETMGLVYVEAVSFGVPSLGLLVGPIP